jgi:hypothetical protein
VITNALAHALWPAGNALGRELTVADGSRLRVIGITEDGTYGGVTVVPQLFTPMRRYARTFTVAVRADVPAAAFVPVFRALLRAIDADLPAEAHGSLDTLLDRSHLFGRGLAALATVFAGLALLICAFGIHAHVSHHVSSRHRELGVRLAIGASPARLAAEVFGSGLRVAAISLALGTLLATATARMVSAFLYGVRPTEPLVHLAVTAAIGMITLASVLLPARRAARTTVAAAISGAGV